MLEIQVLLQSVFQAFVPGEIRETELKKKKKAANQIVLKDPHNFRGLAHSDCELDIY